MAKMDEQEATDRLEELAGGPDKCFRLMRIFQAAEAAASGNAFTLRTLPGVDERFTKRALDEGYSVDAIHHYLNHIR